MDAWKVMVLVYYSCDFKQGDRIERNNGKAFEL